MSKSRLLFSEKKKAQKREQALQRSAKRESQFEKARLLFEKQQKKVETLMARRRQNMQNDFFFVSEEDEEVVGCMIDDENFTHMGRSAEKAYNNSLEGISMSDKGKLIRSFRYVLKEW